MIEVTLPKEYGYVLLMTIWIAFQCYLTGFLVAQPKRFQFFNRDFMKKNFEELHHNEVSKNQPVPDQGYPDMGSGRYSEKLTYKQWFELNLAQRVHQNFLEQILPIVLLTLVAGIKYPTQTVISGAAYSLGRFIMALGYSKKVEGRVVGVTMLNISAAVIVYFATMSMVNIKE
eukprot:403373136